MAYSPAGEGIYCANLGGLHLDMSCCDIYGNEGGDWVGYVADRRGVNGNFWGNPGFCDTLNGDFTLQASSPCMPDELLGCGLIGAHGAGCAGDTLVVDPTGNGDFSTIQAALDASAAWDVVLLEDGVYTDAGNRDVIVPDAALTICSRGGDPSTCWIDCEGSGLSPHRAFRFWGSAGQESMLRGIGVTGGHCGEEEPGGGAIYCTGASPRIAGCLLYRNDGGNAGGALYCGNSSVALVRCTLSGNDALEGGGVYCGGTGHPALQASIVSFSGSGEAVHCDGSASPALSCCCVYGNAGGDWVGCIEDQANLRYNFEVDPCFCAEGEDDYSLHSDSPCAGGWPGCGTIGCMPSGCGIGMCEWPPSTAVDPHALDRTVPKIPLTFVPNPCLEGSRVSFTVPGLTGTAGVELAIHDASGRFVRFLVGGELAAGDHVVLWDGKDQSGRTLPAGVYYCRLRVAGGSAVRPVLLIR